MLIAFLLLSISFIFYMIKEAFDDRVIENEIKINSLCNEELKVFFISDIHKRKITDRLLNKVEEKSNGKVDMVIIGGDLLEEGVKETNIRENLRKLKKISDDVYFTWGNNDYEIDAEKLKNIFKEENIIEFKNGKVDTKFDSIKLVGLDRVHLTHSIIDGKPVRDEDENNKVIVKKDVLNEVLNSIDNDDLNILIVHDPSTLDLIDDMDDFNLVLSGHTHGGQIRLPGFDLYDKGGLFNKGNFYHLISNGYGTSRIPLRLCAKVETNLITLKK